MVRSNRRSKDRSDYGMSPSIEYVSTAGVLAILMAVTITQMDALLVDTPTKVAMMNQFEDVGNEMAILLSDTALIAPREGTISYKVAMPSAIGDYNYEAGFVDSGGTRILQIKNDEMGVKEKIELDNLALGLNPEGRTFSNDPSHALSFGTDRIIPPTAVALAYPVKVKVGEPVTFDLSYCWSYEGSYYYFIEFGDGEIAEGTFGVGGDNKIEHTYQATGIYNAIVSVRDNDGDSTDGITIEVIQDTPEPYIYIDKFIVPNVVIPGDTPRVTVYIRGDGMLSTNPGINLDMTADKNVIHSGDSVTVTYTVTNTGDIPVGYLTPTDMWNNNPTFTGGDDNGDTWLDLNEEWKWEITINPIVDLTYSGSVNGIDPILNDVSDTDSETIDVLNPSIDLRMAVSDSRINRGESVIYTYWVENTGDTELSNIRISDSEGLSITFASGDTDSDGILDNGETWRYTSTQTPLNDVSNTGTVIGKDMLNLDVSASDTIDVDVVIPATLNLQLTADKTKIHSSDKITYTFTVTNSGGKIKDIQVTGTRGNPNYVTGDTNGDGWLDTTETWVYMLDDNPSADVTNTGTVTGKDENGNEISASDSVSIDVLNPGISIDLQASPRSITAGEEVTYTYIIDNTGDTNLRNINVFDTESLNIQYQSGDSDNDGWLDTNEIWVYQGTDTPTNSVTNTATASGIDSLGLTVSDSDSEGVSMLSPGISLEVSVDKDVIHTGDQVTYSFRVTNSGNVAFSSVAIADTRGTSLELDRGDNNNGLLEPGEVWIYESTDNPTASITNGATVTCLDDNGKPISASDTVDITVIDPAINVEVSASSETISKGAQVSYAYTVTNTGNTPLSKVVVTASEGSTPIYDSGDTNSNCLLETDETWVFIATDNPVDSITNTVTATCEDYLGLEVEDEDSIDITVTEDTNTPEPIIPVDIDPDNNRIVVFLIDLSDSMDPDSAMETGTPEEGYCNLGECSAGYYDDSADLSACLCEAVPREYTYTPYYSETVTIQPSSTITVQIDANSIEDLKIEVIPVDGNGEYTWTVSDDDSSYGPFGPTDSFETDEEFADDDFIVTIQSTGSTEDVIVKSYISKIEAAKIIAKAINKYIGEGEKRGLYSFVEHIDEYHAYRETKWNTVVTDPAEMDEYIDHLYVYDHDLFTKKYEESLDEAYKYLYYLHRYDNDWKTFILNSYITPVYSWQDPELTIKPEDRLFTGRTSLFEGIEEACNLNGADSSDDFPIEFIILTDGKVNEPVSYGVTDRHPVEFVGDIVNSCHKKFPVRLHYVGLGVDAEMGVLGELADLNYEYENGKWKPTEDTAVFVSNIYEIKKAYETGEFIREASNDGNGNGNGNGNSGNSNNNNQFNSESEYCKDESVDWNGISLSRYSSSSQNNNNHQSNQNENGNNHIRTRARRGGHTIPINDPNRGKTPNNNGGNNDPNSVPNPGQDVPIPPFNIVAKDIYITEILPSDTDLANIKDAKVRCVYKKPGNNGFGLGLCKDKNYGKENGWYVITNNNGNNNGNGNQKHNRLRQNSNNPNTQEISPELENFVISDVKVKERNEVIMWTIPSLKIGEERVFKYNLEVPPTSGTFLLDKLSIRYIKSDNSAEYKELTGFGADIRLERQLETKID